MLVTETQGDLFANVSEGDAFAHGVNCLGAMGSGIAVPVKRMYPENYQRYFDACMNFDLMPGELLTHIEDGVLVINMATQYDMGANAKYEYVELAAQNLYEYCLDEKIPVVKMPKIGCGIGGLQWDKVLEILQNTGDDNISIEVYYL